MQFIGGYDPVKEEVYEAMANYFSNPSMRWTESKQGMDIYMCRLQSYLLNEHHFLIAMTPSSASSNSTSHPPTPPPNVVVPLVQLKWVSFQVRKLDDYEKYLDMPVHTYSHYPSNSSSFAKQTVEAVHSSRTYTEYTTNISSLIVHLLHVRNSFNEYAMKGTIGSAIETFQAVFVWKEENGGGGGRHQNRQDCSNIPFKTPITSLRP